MRTRTLFISLQLWLTAIVAMAQTAAPTTLDGWAERLQKFGTGIPQEQIFIHMDNTCYFLGDTIYYKAYVRKSDGAPSNMSSVLYAELLNNDGYLVRRQLLELKDGQAHGSFVLQDTLYGGYYELRAYTRWQLNWGERRHGDVQLHSQWFFNKKMAGEFYRDYEKLYSRVFPVYDKPATPGEYVHDMTLRPLRRQFTAGDKPLAGSVALFPEGGHLVAGVPNRVAFEADNEEGMHLKGILTVEDDNGTKVAEAETEQRGRGSVEFTPEAGRKYTALMTWDKGKAKQALPEVEADGVAMRVEQAGGKTTLHVHAAGRAATVPLGLTVMNQGVVLDFRELGTGSSLTATYDDSSLQTGVCQFTVFDSNGAIYADRLAFVKNGALAPQNLTFDGIGVDAAEPFSKVSFSVRGGKGGGTLSLAVRDAAHSEYLYDNGNILTEMLLSSQIRGFVEEPAYFFEADDDTHRRALDLLLMVQGWRRYNWHDMATPGAFVLNHMPEKTPLIIGEVNKYTALETQDEFVDVNDYGTTGERKNRETEMSRRDRNADDNDNAKDNGSAGTGNTPETVSQNKSGKETNLRDRFNDKESPLKREVLVHARFKKRGAEGVVGDMMTKNGQFTIQSPRFFEYCELHLAASDSTGWSAEEKQSGYGWLESGETRYADVNYPEFYVRLKQPYPRFVQPYTWYQCNLADVPEGSAMAPDWINDGTRTLGEVLVGARRNRLTKFNASKPAYVVDAYEALNAACDAGLCTGYFSGRDRFVADVAATYISNASQHREYELELRIDGRLINYETGYHRSSTDIKGMSPMPAESSNISDHDIEAYNHLKNLDKVYIYTDYSPRREGDKRYMGDNRPIVTIDLRRLPGEGRRETFRDRYYVLPGFAVPDEFYQPDYSTRPLPEAKDYRRTLYWNPDLKLDDSGAAEVSFYNNGKNTRIAVSAEGMAGDGSLYSGRSMPEDR